MTKEELEKEAEGYTNKLLEDWELYDPEALQEAYIAGAEPREKQIAELEKEIKSFGERCLQLQKDKGNLIDRCRELEQQIEKMKCCGNCAKNGHICVAEEMQGKLCGKNKDKWELRR